MINGVFFYVFIYLNILQKQNIRVLTDIFNTILLSYIHKYKYGIKGVGARGLKLLKNICIFIFSTKCYIYKMVLFKRLKCKRIVELLQGALKIWGPNAL